MLVALVIFALYVWAGQYWIDLMDEGYFMDLASRVSRGELPYRDFDTYYTPGVFYLYAAVFKLFGVSVIPIRVLMAGVRTICALLLYGLTRRVASRTFAVLPCLMIAAVDPLPAFAEPHPAWMAMVATLLVLECIARHLASRRPHWLLLAGGAAGLAFLFKQNVGAFSAVALAGYVVLRDREHTGGLLRAAQALFAAVLGLTVTAFLWRGLDQWVAAALWLPLLMTVAFLIRRAWSCGRTAAWTTGVRATVIDATLAAAGFVAVTLLWLAPLTIALGRATPFALFLGDVNQGALTVPLEPLPEGVRAPLLFVLWMPLGLAGLLRQPRARPRWQITGNVAIAAILIAWMRASVHSPETSNDELSIYATLDVLTNAFGTLYLYLPALGALAGLTAVALLAQRGKPGGFVPWYLLIGTLAALALYPRFDVLHAMFAGGPLFVVGAWALSRAHQALVPRVGRCGKAMVLASLLVIPLAAVAPHAYSRYVSIVYPDPRLPGPPAYQPLGLARAPVFVPDYLAEDVRGVVEFVRAGTPPGAPFFAYPADPLINFLADRPNPTRFDHFLPGALTAEDMTQVIASLEASQPRYVLWDHDAVVYWRTDLPNRPLSDYIWRCYQQEATFETYLILERRGC